MALNVQHKKDQGDTPIDGVLCGTAPLHTDNLGRPAFPDLQSNHTQDPYHTTSQPPPAVSDNSCDERLEETLQAINWEVLSALACGIFNAKTATWGKQVSGGYNVVRFLCLSDSSNTEIVARVPYYSVGDLDRSGSRIASEVATMEYVATHTRIPVPHVIAHSTEEDGGGVGSPYILMTKIEGAPLALVWDAMEDNQREIILKQVIDIILQLSALRFDRIGAIAKGDGVSNPTWYIIPESAVSHYKNNPASQRTYASTHDYLITSATYHLQQISDDDFGSPDKIYDYARLALMRSIIPLLYDASLDAEGFPLIPGDMHSQNIMIIGADTPSPTITGLIDWEFTTTGPTSSFAQYPLFIVDHPAWDDDHFLKERNVRDQAMFNTLMSTAEYDFNPHNDQRLTHAFANCNGVYLLEQCWSPIIASALYDPLIRYVFGDENFSIAYCSALIAGFLQKEDKQFEMEVMARAEATWILGEENVPRDMNRREFKTLALNNMENIPVLREWLDTYGLRKLGL